MKLEKRQAFGAGIRVAARLARVDALTKLYEHVEKHKTISSGRLLELLDEASDELKANSVRHVMDSLY